MINKWGQDLVGYPFNRSHKFASEERNVMSILMGKQNGVAFGVLDQAACTAKDLVVTVGRGLIYAQGGWFKNNLPININIQPGSTGYIVAQINLSETNTSVGAIDNGTYQYLLNQCQYKAITDTPVKEDLNAGGVRYDVILYSYVANSATLTLTDKREIMHKPDVKGTYRYIGAAEGVFNNVVISTKSSDWNNGIKPTGFGDRGIRYISTPYNDIVSQGNVDRDAFVIIDNGGINSNNNTRVPLFVKVNGMASMGYNTGSELNSGFVRLALKHYNNGWQGNWHGLYDTRVSPVNNVMVATPIRASHIVIPPGMAVGITVCPRIDQSKSRSTYSFGFNYKLDLYLADNYDGGYRVEALP